MNVGYVVLAYKCPEQVLRLLSRIAGDRTSIALHVDRSAPATVYDAIAAGASAYQNVEMLHRQRTYWGGFGLVEATLRGLDHLVRRGSPVEYVMLLTGQDYPIRSRAAIERTLEETKPRSYVHNSPLPYWGWGSAGGMHRLRKWHYVGPRRLRFRVPWERRVPGRLQPFGGEAYWCLSREVAEYVSFFVAKNRSFVRFFRHVLIPDELFFHTIVMNSRFREHVVNDTLHYVDWDDDPGPAILTAADVDRIESSGKLFARKFDVAVDSEVLDLLDARIERDE
jgi:Core-2/I-Branching enzyme